MQTRCPYCATEFQVGEEIITGLDARVRCGMCHTVFNARDHLRVEEEEEIASPIGALPKEDDSPAEGQGTAQQSSRFDFDRVQDIGVEMDDTLRIEDEELEEEEDDTPPLMVPEAPPSAPQPDIFSEDDAASDESIVDEAEGEHRDVDEVPDLIPGLAERKRSRRAPWLAGSLLLMLLVAGQWMYANRGEVMASAQVRPALQYACQWIGCALEPLRDLEAIELLRRSVYSHPNIENALIISLAMVNNATFEQSFPVLMIRMADVRGEIVAQRDFLPEDYLDDSGVSGDMAPGVPVTVTLEIHDPGNDALTFELEFMERSDS
ncbi:MAG: zinc-ribbon and DUF3426 domain-containing protein [Pseudomonadota bacterium]